MGNEKADQSWRDKLRNARFTRQGSDHSYSRWPLRCSTIILLCLREFLVGVWRPAIWDAARLTGTVVDKQLAIDGARPNSFSFSSRQIFPMFPVDTAPVVTNGNEVECKSSQIENKIVINNGIMERKNLKRGKLYIIEIWDVYF